MSGEIWKAYRNGNLTLAQRITVALEHFAIHNSGKLPAVIRVDPKDAQEAITTIKTLGLGLEVAANGSALSGKVWLAVGAEPGAAPPPEAVFEGSADLENGDL